MLLIKIDTKCQEPLKNKNFIWNYIQNQSYRVCMQKIDFIKMHGLGNDFVIIDQRIKKIHITKNIINKLSDRKSGAGCDQLITINTHKKKDESFSSEREILYKVLFDMKSDLNDLKKLTMELMKSGNATDVQKNNEGLIQKIYGEDDDDTYDDSIEDLEVLAIPHKSNQDTETADTVQDKYHFAEEIEEEETLSLHDKELELIKKSLERHQGKRKLAAAELGISERTLYRKIKQYDL